MKLDEALKILNKHHHRFDGPTVWRWVQYNDCGHISGATLTKKKRGKYAGDHDSMDDCWYSDFEVIAIAEKYARDEKGI